MVSQSTVARLTPPVKSLTPTLQDSLNWSHSYVSESNQIESTRLSVESSHVQIESTQLSSLQSQSQSLPMLKLSAIEENKGLSTISFDESVFSSSSSVEFSISISKKSCDSVFDQCKSGDRSCDSNQCETEHHGCHGNCCNSHLKAPSRQESILDDTPQMHRTDESVWNSYAARNLRSMRYGSYSEDSDDQENVVYKNKLELGNSSSARKLSKEKQLVNNEGCKSLTKKEKALEVQRSRVNVTSNSFSYHSDEEEADLDTVTKNCVRKRKFCGIDKSPALKQIYPSNSGLTQEIQVLGLFGDEHRHKRKQIGVAKDSNMEADVDSNHGNQMTTQISESQSNFSMKEPGILKNSNKERLKAKVLTFHCEEEQVASPDNGVVSPCNLVPYPGQDKGEDQTEEESVLMMSGIDNISISDNSDSSPDSREVKMEVQKVSRSCDLCKLVTN